MSAYLHFEPGFDVEEEGTVTVTFTEDGGAPFNASIASGKFFLDADPTGASGRHTGVFSSYSPITDEMQTQWDAATGGTVTVTLDRSTERVTFTATGLTTLVLEFNAKAAEIFGFDASPTTYTGALTYEGDRAPAYFMSTAQKCLGRMNKTEIDIGLAAEGWAADGTPAALAETQLPKGWDFTVFAEPEAAVWLEDKTGSYTWEEFFSVVRHRRPFAVTNDTPLTRFFRNLRDGRKLRAAPMSSDYFAYQDLTFTTQFLGYV